VSAHAYYLQSEGGRMTGHEHLADAVGHSVLYTARGQSTFIYEGSKVIAEHHFNDRGRHVWTLTGHAELWDCWLRLGHLHTDDSIRPADLPLA